LYSGTPLLMGRLISWSGGDPAYLYLGSFHPDLIDVKKPGECLGSLPNNELCRTIGFGSSKSITGRGAKKRSPARAKIIAVLFKTLIAILHPLNHC